jgi:1-phosphatidylinositol-4-phosphate 5-kinase
MSIDTNRLSTHSMVSSSAASFQTAPLTASSSVHTIRDSNPLSKQRSQEIHILQVTELDDTVKLEGGSAVQFTKIMAQHGPPPPSPPASVEQQEEEAEITVISEEPEPIYHPQHLHRSSTDTRASIRTLKALPTPPPTSVLPASPTSSVHSKAAAHLSSDGYLQPPQLSIYRPIRRNTTGSTSSTPKHTTTFPAMASTGELESDIQIHADHIRRERMSKRAKWQQEAEAEAKLTRKEEKSDIVLVGNLIGEGHVNYVLMYNMLTGIRIGVSLFSVFDFSRD